MGMLQSVTDLYFLFALLSLTLTFFKYLYTNECIIITTSG